MATFGNTSEGSYTSTGDWSNYGLGTGAALSESGLISKLTLRIGNQASGHQACHLKGAIYNYLTDDLVAVSSEVSLADNAALAAVDLPFASVVPLDADTHQLCVLFDAAATGVEIRTSAATGSNGYWADTYSDGPADPHGAWTSYNNQPCIYATYTVSSTVKHNLMMMGAGTA